MKATNVGFDFRLEFSLQSGTCTKTEVTTLDHGQLAQFG